MITIITTNENGSHSKLRTSLLFARDFINGFLAGGNVPDGERIARAYRNGVLIKEYTTRSPVLRFNDPLYEYHEVTQ